MEEQSRKAIASFCVYNDTPKPPAEIWRTYEEAVDFANWNRERIGSMAQTAGMTCGQWWSRNEEGLLGWR
jgi:hypothetical protein